MYCKNCGTEIDDKAVVCVNCGAQQQEITQTGGADVPSTLLKVVCFLVPLVGLILFLTMKDNQPISAKAYGKFALIGFIVGIVLSIIASIASCALATAIGVGASDFYY